MKLSVRYFKNRFRYYKSKYLSWGRSGAYIDTNQSHQLNEPNENSNSEINNFNINKQEINPFGMGISNNNNISRSVSPMKSFGSAMFLMIFAVIGTALVVQKILDTKTTVRQEQKAESLLRRERNIELTQNQFQFIKRMKERDSPKDEWENLRTDQSKPGISIRRSE